jgi:homocysteine S-methyltransferase
VLSAARELSAAGVDAVAVVDTSRGPNRMSALAAASLIQRETDIEALAHYTCRGKNMFSMISDLLGAAAVGIRNVLLVSGDPPALGPYPDASAVFDIDAIGLTHVVQGLNRGIDPGGNSIGEPVRFVQGVVLNQGAADKDRELERFGFKIEAGADFAVTQPVFDVAALEPYLERAAERGLPVIAGIWPFPDLRSAEFLANEMPGVTVPAKVVERMRRAQASGPAAAREEGAAIALEAIGAARPLVAGFHVSAPRRKVDMALRVLRDAGVAAGR